MKTLILCTTIVIFLLVETIGYSQTETATNLPEVADTNLKKETSKTEIDTELFKDAIAFIFLWKQTLS